jgi:flagellar hook protein FlgE
LSEADLNAALASAPMTVGGQVFDGSAGNSWEDLSATLPINPSTGQPYTLADIEAASPRVLGLEVATDGTLNWKFTNGTSAPAAWLRLADVRDPGSLAVVGEGLFAPTDAAFLIGDWQSNIPGENGRGKLIGGTIEMSNVDLTSEFADMMASQRSFQASSKMLSVMDELLSTVATLRR